jgi:hypothetical protein
MHDSIVSDMPVSTLYQSPSATLLLNHKQSNKNNANEKCCKTPTYGCSFALPVHAAEMTAGTCE